MLLATRTYCATATATWLDSYCSVRELGGRMKYANDEEIQLGDLVTLWPGADGEVVTILDSKEFSPNYPESEWGYLERGILVESQDAGLIHFIEPERGTRLLKRKADPL